MQMMKADENRIENPPENGIRVTWLGHASVLFQLDNVNVLVNPNFNQRGIKYYHPGDNKRYREPVIFCVSILCTRIYPVKVHGLTNSF